MKNKSSTAFWSLSASLGLVLLAGCGKKETAEEQPAAPAPAAAPASAPIDAAAAATVSGTVKFDGAAPKPAKIDMSQDPNCQGANIAENIVVSDGHLANVFVYVKEGLGNRTFDVPKEEITLIQSGCRYRPHVLGVMAGQTIKIVNGDPTTHNIHPTPKDNREWNESQAPQAPPLEKSFAREEILLPVKCNQHPLMRIFVYEINNTFYTILYPPPKYIIHSPPPRDYTIAFVHEKLGEQEQKVTLAPKDSKTVDATFKPAT